MSKKKVTLSIIITVLLTLSLLSAHLYRDESKIFYVEKDDEYEWNCMNDSA